MGNLAIVKLTEFGRVLFVIRCPLRTYGRDDLGARSHGQPAGRRRVDTSRFGTPSALRGPLGLAGAVARQVDPDDSGGIAKNDRVEVTGPPFVSRGGDNSLRGER